MRPEAMRRGMDRRTLLKASLLAGGGLMLEATMPFEADAAVSGGANRGDARLSAFVSIAPDSRRPEPRLTCGTRAPFGSSPCKLSSQACGCHSRCSA